MTNSAYNAHTTPLFLPLPFFTFFNEPLNQSVLVKMNMKTENCETISLKIREKHRTHEDECNLLIIYIYHHLFFVIYAAINLHLFILFI